MVHPVDSYPFDDDELEEDEMDAEDDNDDEEVMEASVVAQHEEDEGEEEHAVESVAVDESSADEEDGAEEVAEVQAVEDDGDRDEEVVIAAVVVDDGNPAAEEEEEVVSVAEPVQVVSSAPAKKRKRATASTATGKKGTGGRRKPAAGSSSRKNGAGKRKGVGAPKTKSGGDRDSRYDSAGIPGPRIDAAGNARKLLVESVPTLPANLGDSQVRAFGRLPVTTSGSNNNENAFATTTALYSVGFSCDLYDFSPAHGRMLKLRCSILDGRRILQQRQERGIRSSLVIDENVLREEPVFRIMWGRGVDEDDMDEYKYDPYLHSDYMLMNSKGGQTKRQRQAVPVEDMRVKTRFDQNEYYMGTIVKVIKSHDGKHGEKVTLSIRCVIAVMVTVFNCCLVFASPTYEMCC